MRTACVGQYALDSPGPGLDIPSYLLHLPRHKGGRTHQSPLDEHSIAVTCFVQHIPYARKPPPAMLLLALDILSLLTNLLGIRLDYRWTALDWRAVPFAYPYVRLIVGIINALSVVACKQVTSAVVSFDCDCAPYMSGSGDSIFAWMQRTWCWSLSTDQSREKHQ